MIPPTPVAHGHHDAVVAEDSHGALSVRGACWYQPPCQMMAPTPTATQTRPRSRASSRSRPATVRVTRSLLGCGR